MGARVGLSRGKDGGFGGVLTLDLKDAHGERRPGVSGGKFGNPPPVE